jgi:hypothetical protein
MGLMKKLTAAIATSSLLVTMVGTAFAAYTPSNAQASCDRMMSLQILKGKYADNACALNDEITRAELATIVVRAFGQEDNAALLNGAAAFPDTANHWASGYIAIAKNLIEKQGDTVGMPDGTFQPDKKLSPAEAVAFLMKFLGQKPDNTKAWPDNYLSRAVEINLITKADADTIAPMLNDNATRGLVFALYDNAYAKFDLGGGKTFYTKYVDTTAPVLTLDTLEATTLANKVTVTGKVEGASELYVGTEKATIGANGSFSQDVALTEVGEKTITVVAKDVAGNSTTKTLTVTRTVGDVAAIEAADVTVAAGEPVAVTAVAKDIAGNELKDAVVTGTSTLGTYADGTFTAGEKVGTGTLKLTAGTFSKEINVTVTAGAIAAVNASATSIAKGDTATLTATDKFGNAVTGATYTVDGTGAYVVGNTFIGSAAGSYTVTGTVNGKTATTKIGVYGAAYNVAVISAPETITGNNSTEKEVKVALVDKNGNIVASDDTSKITLTPSAGLHVKANTSTATYPAADAVTQAVEATVTDGVASFKVKADAGFDGVELTLTATPSVAIANGATTQSAKVTLASVAQVATSVKVAAPTFLPNGGGSQNVNVSVLDQDGVAMVADSGYWPLTVAVSGPATANTTAGTYNYGGGAAVAIPVTPKTGYTGDVTVTVTVDGVGTKSATLKNVYPTAATQVKVSYADDETSTTVDKANNRLTVNFELQDANGVPVNAPADIALTVTAKNAAGDTVDLTGSKYYTDGLTTGKVTIADGEGTAALTIGSDVAGTLALSFANSDYTISGGATLTFNAGDATHVALVRNNTIAVPVSDPKASLSAQIYDDFGNKVAKAGVEVTFDAATDEVSFNGTAQKLVATTDANGVATVTVATRPFGGTEYTVTVSGTDDLELAATAEGADDVTIAVANQVATKVEVSVVRAADGLKPSSAPAGTDVYLRATVKDQYGAAMADQADFLALNLASEVLWDADAEALTDALPADAAWAWNSVAGRYEIQVSGTETAITLAKAGTVALGVKDTAGQTEIAGTTTVVVNADRTVANAKVTVKEADSTNTISVKKGTVAGPFTLMLTDMYGNSFSAAQAVTVTFDASAAAIAVRNTAEGVSAATTTLNSTKAFYVAASSAATGTYTITFLNGETELGTVTVSITQ